MALVLNPEQSMLQQSARDFLSRQTPVKHLRSLRDAGRNKGFSPDAWAEMSALGWPAMAIPEEYAGLGFGFTGLGIVLQETGRTLTPCPLLSSAMMVATAVVRAGNEAQKRNLLPGIASGEIIATLAFEELAQHRPERITTTAKRTADGFCINGRKRFVLDGVMSDQLIISALTHLSAPECEGISLFVVSATAPGVTITPCEILDTHVAADVMLRDVQVPATALLGGENAGFAILEGALDAGRIGQSAELLGVALEAFERSIAYLRERKQFGVPIGSFQALQHRAAALFSELEMCKSLVLDALHRLDAGDAEIAATASMTKAKLAETADKATAEAIQWHGGIGMTDQFEIGFFYKRARILETFLGDRYFHLDRFARLRGF
jgi:alkylation response protein AidB-like acyl-CoA dehydrogenase